MDETTQRLASPGRSSREGWRQAEARREREGVAGPAKRND